mmetsp:Transcript_3564/g.9161  ORF Transcript_3564/g.9161 Transcript_3564/m.9161 type:complete len:211 (+) Transcript_3564:112-744(+)
MVPELEYKGKAMNDATTILRFLDTAVEDEKEPFVPSGLDDDIAVVDADAEGFFEACCEFFNYVDRRSYEASVRQSLSRYIPWWAFWIDIDAQTAWKRDKAQATVDAVLATRDVDVVRARLHDRLRSYDDRLATQDWLVASPHPTLADFAIYAKLARITDQLGDVSIGSAQKDILDGDDLANVRAWFARMQRRSPLRWKGKRVPTTTPPVA